jgi:hypothetical protein
MSKHQDEHADINESRASIAKDPPDHFGLALGFIEILHGILLAPLQHYAALRTDPLGLKARTEVKLTHYPSRCCGLCYDLLHRPGPMSYLQLIFVKAVEPPIGV